jgi:hypothetical protein
MAMVEFTPNDVLLIHNNDVLTYAVDSIGNRKFQVYLDIYRSSFLYAEERKDTITCDKILNDITNTICTKSVPNGRFLEFDEKKNIWYDVGTGAIPCQRARTGLLGLLGNTTSNEYHTDKPVVVMGKTKRARTMKALHQSEKILRSVVNLNDDRFKVNKELLMNDSTLYSRVVLKKVCNGRPSKKRVTFADSIMNDSKTFKKNEKEKPFKKMKSVHQEELVNVTCGGVGEGILHIDTPGNKLFHSLINARKNKYCESDDQEKFKEVCKVIDLMTNICPSCRFVEQRENSTKVTELAWQDIVERTIQSFCNNFLSDMEIREFIASVKGNGLNDECIADASSFSHDTIIFIDNEVEIPDEVLPTISVDDDKAETDKLLGDEDFLFDENEYHLNSHNEYVDVFFTETNGSLDEFTEANEFLESILVS